MLVVWNIQHIYLASSYNFYIGQVYKLLFEVHPYWADNYNDA